MIASSRLISSSATPTACSICASARLISASAAAMAAVAALSLRSHHEEAPRHSASASASAIADRPSAAALPGPGACVQPAGGHAQACPPGRTPAEHALCGALPDPPQPEPADPSPAQSSAVCEPRRARAPGSSPP
eukprot:CAMPEP_0119063392 /NCGR_PEP_ID=MMETSP1178-20130426/6748_1 /TAXON_ID=33656 /ORGANISM="unid sp, Strain CCMP2000" /LENGTH=134 /DNA_ID=CAMNT_0007044759 /DNA_START=330 /DNA_END=732 /DNA_ORIENTATION=+